MHILGNTTSDRLPVFSFMVRQEQTGLYLHPNFVCSLLNDMFGIQTRAGCVCAGPYAQYLLGIDYELAKEYERVLVQDERLDKHNLRMKHDTSHAEILRPAFTRFNLAFFFDQQKIQFVLDAIEFVCKYGWYFSILYKFNMETGEFRHRNYLVTAICFMIFSLLFFPQI